jgi:hypothetical protein
MWRMFELVYSIFHRVLLLAVILSLATTVEGQPRSGAMLTPYDEIKEVLLNRHTRKYEIVVKDKVSFGNFNGLMHESNYSYRYINDSVVVKTNMVSMSEQYFVRAGKSFYDYSIKENKRLPSYYYTTEKDSAGSLFIFEYVKTGPDTVLNFYEKMRMDKKGRVTYYTKWDRWGMMSDLFFTFKYLGDSMVVEKGYRQLSDSAVPYRDIITRISLSKDKHRAVVTKTTRIYDPEMLSNGEHPNTVSVIATNRDKKGRLIRKEQSTDGELELVLEISYLGRKERSNKISVPVTN